MGRRRCSVGISVVQRRGGIAEMAWVYRKWKSASPSLVRCTLLVWTLRVGTDKTGVASLSEIAVLGLCSGYLGKSKEPT